MINDLTVLYVEDDEVVRENFQEILEQYFSKVIISNNGKTALDLYNIHNPDVAILDISLPDISGLQVASIIRKKNREMQIIMLTAYDDKEKLLQALNLQLFAYLVKPVQYPKFDVTLKNLLKTFESKNSLHLLNDFIWNKSKEELSYKGFSIKLTNNERLILMFLSNYPNQYFSAYEIALEVLEEHDTNDNNCNNIVQLLSRFKNKILKEFEIKVFFIENSYGRGYKIIIKVD